MSDSVDQWRKKMFFACGKDSRRNRVDRGSGDIILRTVRIRESGRSTSSNSHGVIIGEGGIGFRKGGRQCCGFLNSHSQTVKEFAKVNR